MFLPRRAMRAATVRDARCHRARRATVSTARSRGYVAGNAAAAAAQWLEQGKAMMKQKVRNESPARVPAAALRLAVVVALLAPLAAGCATARPPATWQPAAPRVVAIGDVHGDLDAARAALRLAGAIDDRDRWTGGQLVVVQTGDQLDRGDQERAILHLFDRLSREADRAGGAFHVLNGNHELMNARLDLRYVTPGGFQDFADVAPPNAARDTLLAQFPPEEQGRVAAFRPGGRYARMLSRRNTIVMVGDNVFVHGGVLPAHAQYGIDRINEEIRAWLRGETPAPPWSAGAEAPIWTRLYSREVDEAACAVLAESLGMLGARRMIVAHTVHRNGITSYCDERVWVVDVGMAAYYRGPVEVLEIRGDTLTVLRRATP
jgi:hypothetical protein